MSKRDQQSDNYQQPSTPIAESKRSRDSSGSLNDLRTPLKNIQTGSVSFDCISPRPPGEEDEEKRRNRAELVKKQQESREALRSPSTEFSPRAEPSSSITPNLKRSVSGSSSGLINDNNLHTNPASSSPNSLTAHGTRSILTASKSKLSLSSTKLSSSQPPLALTVEQMTKSFDEWMKMAADNKINSKNSWNFALIDYFSELTFLRDGDSINFQKASCTLDGCVKIYASRVDSVVDETTKLLNGLSDKSNKFKESSIRDEDEEDESLEDGGNQKQQKSKIKKTSMRTIETIEKNPENLILKNFDLEFSIDPLFKKTSAEFDESGSKGALLKNLECSPIDNLIIFDSSDQIPMDFSLETIPIDSREDDSIDISLLSSVFGSLIIDLDSKSLCPSFEQYNFNGSLADIKGTLEKLSKISANIPQDTTNQSQLNDSHVLNEEEDLLAVIENDDNFNDNLNFGNDDYCGDDDEDDGEDTIANLDNQPLSNSVKWSTNDEVGLSYFDGAFKQTWAGPEHWKIRKSQRVASNTNSSSTTTTSNNIISSRTGKRKVEKIAVDFINSVIDFRQIFSKPTNSSQISLTKASILERNEQDHLLPDDLHFSSSNLLKLFIKPCWKLLNQQQATGNRNNNNSRSTRSAAVQNQKSLEISGNFIEKDFWVSREDNFNGLFHQESNEVDLEDDFDVDDQDQDEIIRNDMNNHENLMSNCEDGLIADENNENSYTTTNIIDTDRNEVDFTKIQVAAPKFTYAPQLNYARVAKRVDVAKLKSTLWNEFLIESQAQNTKKSVPASIDDNSNSSVTVSSSTTANTFSSLMNNLSKTYPKESLSDVSVPYCFICLLHLANEKNLDIQNIDHDLIIRN